MRLEAGTFWNGTGSFYRLNRDVKPLVELKREKMKEEKERQRMKEMSSIVGQKQDPYRELDPLTEGLVEIIEIIPKLEPSTYQYAKPESSTHQHIKTRIKIQRLRLFQLIAKQVKRGKEIVGRWNGKNWKVLFPAVKYGAQSILVSMLIFFIGYLTLNYQAYFQIFNHYWKNSDSTQEFFARVSNRTNTQAFLAQKMTQDGKADAKIPDLMPIATNREKFNIPTFSIVSPDNRIIIPKIDKNIPIVETASKNRYEEKWEELEKNILNDLKNGVVHYPGTAQPGQKGNVVMTGHSSYYPWDEGKYKDVFALLDKLEIGDEIIIYFQQKEYRYNIIDFRDVNPDDINVLEQKDGYKLSLITCTPLGTNLRRLVVTAEQIR
ncbi:class E sortase [Candidatus Peregrinibacteria bacterium]|nr:class E sortase [Candidatus Peregrinibacteria bacterium]